MNNWLWLALVGAILWYFWTQPPVVVQTVPGFQAGYNNGNLNWGVNLPGVVAGGTVGVGQVLGDNGNMGVSLW